MNHNKRTLFRTTFLIMLLLLCMSVSSSAAALSSRSLSLLVGKSSSLTLSGVTGQAVWKSSKASVASVDQNGRITAKKRGTATISAKINRKTYKCKVTVKQPVTGISLNRVSYTLQPGTTVSLKAKVVPSKANNKKIIWSSSNSRIARVSNKGVVTAGHKGSVIITATAADGSGVKAACRINILPGFERKDVTAASSRSTAKALRFLNVLEKYSRQIENEVSTGKDWIYSNTHPAKTFQEALNTNNRVCNCALMAVWALKDIGVLSYKQGFWGEAWSTIHYSGNGSKKALLKGCTVTKVSDSLENLIAAGKLKSGDILTYDYGPHGHTDVFLGYTAATGTYHFYDAGRNGQNVAAESDGYHHFSTLHYDKTDGRDVIAYIIRIK